MTDTFSFKAVGVSFADDYPDNLLELRDAWGLAKGIGEGTLIREPDNQYDPDAVAILTGGRVVGHVPRALASKLALRMDTGARYTCELTVLVADGHEEQPGLLVEARSVED